MIKTESNSVTTAIGIIPARFASARLPGKPLVEMAGKPMIQHVWEGARSARRLSDVIIATDDTRIRDVCESFGARACITDPALPSGTDRIYAAYRQLDRPCDIIVNIQGDEPLLEGLIIDELIETLERDTTADVATPIQTIDNDADLYNPAVVKTVVNAEKRALYFSRSPVPYIRMPEGSRQLTDQRTFWKHIGLYAYRSAALERFTSLPPSDLEGAESLEQLRLIEDGAVYVCTELKRALHGVDTPEDVARVRAILDARAAGT